MLRLFWIMLIVISGISADTAAAESPLDTANIRAGCWVEYAVVIDSNPKDRLVFNCFIKLYDVRHDFLDFEYKIDGIGKRVEISRKDFPLLRLVPKLSRATSFKESSEEKYIFTEMDNQAVDTVHDVWNYENGITEVWTSRNVPFSVVKVSCKGFRMELRAFSWAKE